MAVADEAPGLAVGPKMVREAELNHFITETHPPLQAATDSAASADITLTTPLNYA